MAIDLTPQLRDAVDHWSLSGVTPVAETSTSHVWRVRLPAGGPAALKIVTPRGGEEIVGADFLAWRDGAGAARLFGRSGPAMLIEWLAGPSLGDKARAGDVDGAIEVIAGLLPRLQAPGAGRPGSLVPLDTRFAALMDLDLATLALPYRASIGQAQARARRCLAGARSPRPLHGDLHHDNIRHSARGWLAFDPKGVWGDPAYEAANLFQNPERAPHISLDPAYHTALAARLASGLGVTERRLREWAAAHAGLSVAWHLADGRAATDDLFRSLWVLLEALSD